MAERSEVVEEQTVPGGSAVYAVQAEITTSEDVPPGYKRTEVGMIPEDWNDVSVSELANVKGGKRLPKGHSLIESPTPYPYIRVADLLPGKVDGENIKFVPEKAFHSIQNYRIYKNDLFISVAGTLGLVGAIPGYLDGANLTENADRITDIECDRDYLMYWLMSEPIQKVIESIRTVGAQPKLALGRIANFQIAIPSTLDEQRAIATALSDADALIESLERLIAKKRAIKQAGMQQLLTGQTRLPGFTGEWKTKRLGDHVAFLKTGTSSRAELTSSGSVAYLHYGDIHVGASVMLNPNAVSVPHIAASKVCHVDKLAPGDLVFVDASEDLDGVGKSVEIIGVPKGGMVAGLHTIAARFDKDVLADGFKAYLQFCPRFIGILRRLAAGTKVLATNRQHIASVELRLPGTSEQNAIATVLSDMDTEIEALERRRDKARQIKQGMMHQLLTGRVRLVAPQTMGPAAC